MFLGVDQKGAAFEDVVGTDGIELQKVFNRPRNDPTPATKLSDDEETDLETARYGTEEDGALKNGFETSLADTGGRRASEDETSLKSEKRLKKNEGLLTSGSDRKGNGRHDTRINRNFELKERLNIDSDRSKDQRHAARDSTTKVGQKKLVQSAEKGQAAEFEASIGDRTSSVPVTNSSASTPPPYILKLKHPPAKAELDDIYFLCKCFLLILFFYNSPQIYYQLECYVQLKTYFGDFKFFQGIFQHLEYSNFTCEKFNFDFSWQSCGVGALDGKMIVPAMQFSRIRFSRKI